MRIVWYLAALVVVMSQVVVAQECRANVTWRNITCSCSGEVWTSTTPSGTIVNPPFGYTDGEAECGSDGLGNSCTGPQVVNCSQIQGRSISPKLSEGKKILALTTSDYTVLETLVPFCGSPAQPKRELLFLRRKKLRLS